MRLTYLACTLGTLVACTPGTGTTDTTVTSTTTGSQTTGSQTTGSQTTSATDPGDTTTTAAPTTGTDTTATSTAVTTSATTEPATTEPATGTTTESGETSTTGTADNACVVDADCALHSDCCTCEGVPVDLDFPFCDERCDQSQCSALGIDEAVCRLGVCETERLHCNQAVACDQAPPACPPDHLPETTDTCYTGKCVPAALCDVVADCAQCPAHMMCVQKFAFVLDSVTCEPIPPSCNGTVDCACVGDLVCTDMYSACFAQGAVVNCECPNC